MTTMQTSEITKKVESQLGAPEVMPIPSQAIPTNAASITIHSATNNASAFNTNSSCKAIPATSPKSTPTSKTPVLNRFEVSPLHKYTLLFLFCLSQVLDTLNNGALWAAIPTLSRLLGMSQAQSTWLITTYQLTFASFLLISGRISDVYGPKGAFITGMAGVCVISVIGGFVKQAIGLIVLRAILGIVAALSIPSSISLLIAFFPEPREQARAFGIYTGCNGVANTFGLTLGAFFVQYASWSWCFWFSAIMATPLVVMSFWLVPNGVGSTSSSSLGSELGAGSSLPSAQDNSSEGIKTKAKGLDLIGVSVLTAAFILFVFSVTSGSSYGWASVPVLVPLISSLALIGVFLYWETRLPEHMAAIPPKTWFYPNFIVIFFLALLPYFWWNTSLSLYMTYWPASWGWSELSTVIHMLPLGISGFVLSFSGPLSRAVNPKWLIFTGLSLMAIAAALLTFASTPDTYWTFVLPGLIIGSGGAMVTYTHLNIAIFHSTPPSTTGTVGAIFNAALLMGSVLGISIVNSVATSIDAKYPDATGALAYKGRQAGFYVLLGCVCAGLVGVALFFKTEVMVPEKNSEGMENRAVRGKVDGEKAV